MIPFTACIFDLDGTLLDTAGDVVGLMAEVVREHGLSDAGVTSDTVVGPPLAVGISRACPGLDDDTVQAIVTAYRARYTASNYPNTKFYPGILELLDGLDAMGISAFLATNKSVGPATRVLAQFGLTHRLVEAVSADQLPGQAMSKAQMIRKLVAQHDLDPRSTVMIGDTELDVLGGREAGVLTLAALYGYGTRASLMAAKPTYYTEKPDWRNALIPCICS